MDGNFAIGGQSLVCRCFGQPLRAPPFFPMLVPLRHKSVPHHNRMLIRCVWVPDHIRDVILPPVEGSSQINMC